MVVRDIRPDAQETKLIRHVEVPEECLLAQGRICSGVNRLSRMSFPLEKEGNDQQTVWVMGQVSSWELQ